MNLKLDAPPRKVPLSRALKHREAASNRDRLCSKVWNRPALKKNNKKIAHSTFHGWVNVLKKKKKKNYSTASAIIRLNPSQISWRRSGAAIRREQPVSDVTETALHVKSAPEGIGLCRATGRHDRLWLQPAGRLHSASLSPVTILRRHGERRW